MYIKKVKYKNKLGTLFFNNHTLFCEEIDMTGTPVLASTEQLAMTHGSVTTSVYMGAKTIPCSFKFVDRYDDIFMHSQIVRVLNPLITGTLTVFTENRTLEIDCRPSEMPSIRRTELSWIYQWQVDFIADYPFWRIAPEQKIFIKSANTTVDCRSDVDTPIKIFFPPGVSTPFWVSGSGFTLHSVNNDVGMTVDTKTYSITGTDGNDYSQSIGRDSISGCVLKPGKNNIFCPGDGTGSGVIVTYNELVLGAF